MCLIIAQSFDGRLHCFTNAEFLFQYYVPYYFQFGFKEPFSSHTQQASLFIVMGVVGGAVFPPLMGLIANL
jgi:FHS family L-fucose permease-like MFS transporter